MRDIILDRDYLPSDFPRHNEMDLCKLFSSCNQRDIITLIFMNCQNKNYWTPTLINDAYSSSLGILLKKNIIDHFGNNYYCITNNALKSIYHYINGK